MGKKDAFYLLFSEDYGKGPLFKNQIDLVNELVNNPNSAYFTPRNNVEGYNKTISRLKAYISQLFSEDAKRNITNDFRHSLEIIVANKIDGNKFNLRQILDSIFLDLYERNITPRSLPSTTLRRNIRFESDFFENLLEAKYVTIFTPREINIEFNILNRKQTLVDLLLDDLFNSLKEHTSTKHFRFNFPLENTCILFWRGLEKAVIKYLSDDNYSLSFILPLLISNKPKKEPFPIKDNETVLNIASKLLEFLSANKIINVFHLSVPVYLTPSIAINPNDPISTSVYLLLQSATGEDQIHKLSNQEVLSWRFFVWDNLKINNSGKEITYLSPF